jgi:diazepam-binding inhibitor (GABA receptor modulator, acyl-CoA-binding protein)
LPIDLSEGSGSGPASRADRTLDSTEGAAYNNRPDAIEQTIKTITPGDPVAANQAKFDQAVADSKNLSERPDNQTLLKLYALYKQATSGDADGKRPGFTDMVGRAKWDAWNELKGTAKDAASQQYIDLIEELKG